MGIQRRLGAIACAFGLALMACTSAGDDDASSQSAKVSGTSLDHVLAMNDSQIAIAALSDQLDAELARVGPGLTKEQQTAYVAQFASDVSGTVKDEQSKYRAAADALAAEAKARLAEVIATAKSQGGASASGEELYSDYLILAKSDHAAESIRFMNSVAHDPVFAKLMAIDDGLYDDDHPRPEDVVATAVPYVVAKALAQNEQPDAIVSGLKTLLATGLSDSAIGIYDGAFNAIDIVHALQLRRRQHLAALLPIDKIDKIGDRGAAKLLFGLGTAFALWNAKDSLENGDLTEFLTTAAGAAPDTLAIIGGFAESIHAFKPFAEKLVSVGEKIGPGIDLVLSAISTAQDVQAVLANNDPALKARLFGDALTTLGAIIVFVSPEVAAVVIGIGTAIAFVSDIVVGQHERDAADREVAERTSKVLQKTGAPKLDEATADRIATVLVKVEDTHLWDVSEYPLLSAQDTSAWFGKRRLGLTSAQIQSLADRAPGFIDHGEHTGNGVDGMFMFETQCLVASPAIADLQNARNRLAAALGAAITASGEAGVLTLSASMNQTWAQIADCAGWRDYLSDMITNGAPELGKAASAFKPYAAAP